MEPVISVVIPVYNVEKYLAKCLDSLLSQTFQKFEAICVDDGSTDDSLQILQQYAAKDSRIKVFSQKNGGAAKARNFALSKASGTYLMFCDSDDWYEPDMCAEMYHNMIQNDVDMVCCNPYIIDEQQDILRDDSLDSYENKFSGICELSYPVVTRTSVTLWNKILKKSLVDQYGIRFPETSCYEDDGFYFQYASIAKNILFTDKRLYNYLRRENSLMGQASKRDMAHPYEKFYVAKFYYEFLLKHHLFEEKSCFFYHYLMDCGAWGKRIWHKDRYWQVKDVLSGLFSDNVWFLDFVFPQKKRIALLFFVETLLKLKKQHVCKKYAFGIGNRKIFGCVRYLSDIDFYHQGKNR